MKIDARKLQALITSQGYTKTRLAKKAGLSRQALQTILNKDWADVRQATLQGLAQALNLPDPQILGADALASYKACVADEHAHLDFRGLGLAVAEPRHLDALFVPIRVRPMPTSKHRGGCEVAPSEDEAATGESALWTEENLGERLVAECLFRHRRLLFRGDPGSGKTTSLRHIARSYAKGTQAAGGYPDRPLTPIFVRLADYAEARERDGDLSLVRFVLTSIRPEASLDSITVLEGLLEDALLHGACLVLLDGLDEVGRNESLAGLLREFVAHYPDNLFVLTSRSIGLDEGPWIHLGFASYQITRWREEDIRRFALRWYTSRLGKGGQRQSKENERRATELTAAILKHRPLREIASNPLMLTILAAMYHANASLPRRRVDLYAKVVEVLLETWETEKRDARPGDPLHGILLDAREFDWLLSRLALAMQRQDRVLTPRWWVTEFVQQFMRETLALEGEKAKDQSDRVIRYLCERSGLLVERGADIFGFSHRVFQEYFAARGILAEAGGASGDSVSLLRPHLYHPRWEEVVRLVAAQLGPAPATALLRTILDDADLAGRFLRRGLRLALRCLVDGVAVADRRLLDQLFSDGRAIGESKWVQIALDIIDSLIDLKVSRHAAEADRMLKDIGSAERSELPPVELLVDWFASRYEPPGNSQPATEVPGAVYSKQLGRHQVNVVSLAPRLRREAPDEWYSAVFRLLRSAGASKVPVKRIFIEDVLRYEADKNEQVRRLLEDRLERDGSPTIREACAWGLQQAAANHPSTVNKLLRRMKEDKSPEARRACAAALWKVAPQQASVRDQLLAVLDSSAIEEVRSGAARGLRKVIGAEPQLLQLFITHSCSPDESSRVRIACLNVISESLGQDPAVSECLLSSLDDTGTPAVQRIAAQIVAEALADGRLPWSLELVVKVETILMAVTNPCVHAWQALGQLVDAKEIRGGLRMEQILRSALVAFEQRLAVAFIFGSVARREQHQDSDIDLLIIGDVRLKELTPALRTAEQALGRIINPALYTATAFKEKYQTGDPFLLEIVRNEKIFLKGNSDELRELVAERASE